MIPGYLGVHTCVMPRLLYIHTPIFCDFDEMKYESGWVCCASYMCRKVACMKMKISIALLLALAPTLALAKPREATVHLRTQTFHDRSPRIHSHESLPHHA